MITQNAPHLRRETDLSLYPATKEAFKTIKHPEIDVVVTAAPLNVIYVLLFLTIIVPTASLFLYIYIPSQVLIGVAFYGLGALSISSLIALGWYNGRGTLRGAHRVSYWVEMERLLVYFPMLPYANGIYVRRGVSEKQFIYIPWNIVSDIMLSQEREVIFTLTRVTSPLLRPEEVLETRIHIPLKGAFLKGFNKNERSPEGVTNALNEILLRFRTGSIQKGEDSSGEGQVSR